MVDAAPVMLVDGIEEGQQVMVVEGILRECTGHLVAMDGDDCLVKPDGWVDGAYVQLPRHLLVARTEN
jgi:hypothetical protein